MVKVKGQAGLFREIEKWLRSRVRHPRYRHVFHGEINANGRVPRGTGFHHRFQGQNPPGARVRVDPRTGREMISDVAVDGTYRARVEVLGLDGNWHAKRGKSSFFPDNWTPQRVDQAINEAFRRRKPHPDDPAKWLGIGNGLRIEGFYNKQGSHWHSAWPSMGG